MLLPGEKAHESERQQREKRYHKVYTTETMAGRGKGGKGLGKGGGMVTLVCIYVCVMCLKKK